MAAITNREYADLIADAADKLVNAVVDEAGYADLVFAATNLWTEGGLSMPQLAANMSNVLGNWNAFTLEWRNWLSGTATGGYDSDGTPTTGVAPHGGYYPLRNGLGDTFYVPSQAKVLSDTAKGDKGDPADTDVTFFVQGLIGAGELFMAFMAPVAMEFDMVNAAARALAAPAGGLVQQMKKNGTNINTITWSTGNVNAVITTTALTLAKGDRLTFHNAGSMDMSLSDVMYSFPGLNVE